MSEYFVKYVNENTVLPKKELHSAVFLLAIKGTKILTIKNERGWDIPGGHIEEGEDCIEALIREVQEEAGATFSDPKLLAIVESDTQGKYKDKVMFIYTTDIFELGEFIPSEDAIDREIIEIEEFLKRYKDAFNFREIIERAKITEWIPDVHH